MAIAFWTRFVATALASVVCNTPVLPQQRPLTIIAANAVKDGLEQLTARYRQQTGQEVDIVWSGTVTASKRIMAGEGFDAVLIGSDAIDHLAADGYVRADSRTPFARTGIAAAVRAGYEPLKIGSVEALRDAVRAAPRIAYSAGPSGAYIASLMTRLGLSVDVATKLKQPSSGAEVAELLRLQEVDLAFAQVSEFMNIPGIQELGPLPAELQNYTTYTVAATSSSANPAALEMFVRFLTSPSAKDSIAAMGMDQVR